MRGWRREGDARGLISILEITGQQLINTQGCWRKMQAYLRRTDSRMTEYIIREVGLHQWLLFADRKSIALCTAENEAVKVMIEDSARRRCENTARSPGAPLER